MSLLYFPKSMVNGMIEFHLNAAMRPPLSAMFSDSVLWPSTALSPDTSLEYWDQLYKNDFAMTKKQLTYH